jgi:glycerol kinase
MWAGLKELRSAWRPGKQFKPKMKPEVREAHLARWRSAVTRA